jgi:drug/metabolite transporter (DMT)-like permease
LWFRMCGEESLFRYYAALFGTVLFWGTSFPIIKYLMYFIDPYTYTWVRGLFSIIFLTPCVLYHFYRNGFRHGDLECLRGGLFAGVFYSLGLWLQAWGTGFTTASNSAFITGLNVLFVHLYVGFVYKRYSWGLGFSLLLSIAGLYLLTRGTIGFYIIGFGDFLVLLSAIMWAGQVLVIDKYSRCNPLVLVYYMFMPTLFFIIPSSRNYMIVSRNPIILVLLIYLALICNIAAFTLQVYGQKKIEPEKAAIIYLLEPVIATTLSYTILGETITIQKTIGATLILISIYTATKRRNGGGAPK